MLLKLARVATSTCEWGDAERMYLKSDKEVVVEIRTDWEKGDWAEVQQIQVLHYGEGENSWREAEMMDLEGSLEESEKSVNTI